MHRSHRPRSVGPTRKTLGFEPAIISPGVAAGPPGKAKWLSACHHVAFPCLPGPPEGTRDGEAAESVRVGEASGMAPRPPGRRRPSTSPTLGRSGSAPLLQRLAELLEAVRQHVR